MQVDSAIGDGGDPKAKELAMKWLAELAERSDKFVACHVYNYGTYYIYSTQRAEATHSSMQQWCSTSMLITSLVKKLDMKAESTLSRSFTKALRADMRLSASKRFEHSAVVALKSALTPYARVLQRLVKLV